MLTGHDCQSQQSSRQLDTNGQADVSSRGVKTGFPEALAAEWEQCLTEQSADTAISHLFEQELQEAQQHISIPGMPALSAHSVNRSHCHTLTHTGEPPATPLTGCTVSATEALSQGVAAEVSYNTLPSQGYNHLSNVCTAVDAAGLMLWESAPTLAAYLLANPHLLSSISLSAAPCVISFTVCTSC